MEIAEVTGSYGALKLLGPKGKFGDGTGGTLEDLVTAFDRYGKVVSKCFFLMGFEEPHPSATLARKLGLIKGYLIIIVPN